MGEDPSGMGLTGLSIGGLAMKQKRFRKRLERTEFLVPMSFRHFGLRGDPESKLVEVNGWPESRTPINTGVEQDMKTPLRS
jgi:hypothetical protein